MRNVFKGIPLTWVLVATLLIASIAATIIISNILGPYQIHVGSEPSQLLELSASTTPPSEVPLGATVNISITVTNPSTSSDVQGYVVVNITASDFTLGTSNVTLSTYMDISGGAHGWYGFSATPITSGFMYKTTTQFLFPAGSTSTANIYIVFNKANPTAEGYYEVTIGVSSD